MDKMDNVPPDVERQLETGYQDALVEFPGPIAQCMFACKRGKYWSLTRRGTPTSVGIETLVFLSVVVRWIVLVES